METDLAEEEEKRKKVIITEKDIGLSFTRVKDGSGLSHLENR